MSIFSKLKKNQTAPIEDAPQEEVLFPKYTKEELETSYPMSYIVSATSYDTFIHKNHELNYPHFDYAIINSVVNPTAIILLTGRKGLDFPEACPLKIASNSAILSYYSFELDGKKYSVMDDKISRLNAKNEKPLQELLTIADEKNQNSINNVKKRFDDSEEAREKQSFVDSMFAK